MMGKMQFFSPTQQCQGATETVPGSGSWTTRIKSTGEQGKGPEIQNTLPGQGRWITVCRTHPVCIVFIEQFGAHKTKQVTREVKGTSHKDGERLGALGHHPPANSPWPPGTKPSSPLFLAIKITYMSTARGKGKTTARERLAQPLVLSCSH